MTTPLTGGCLCGAVRYESAAEPVMSGICHCRNCQKMGGDHMAVLAVPKTALKTTGDLRYFDTPAESGATVSRGFCPVCGSAVLSRTTSLPDLMMISAGSLDDLERFVPTMHVFTRSAATWDVMDPRLPNFPELPDLSQLGQ